MIEYDIQHIGPSIQCYEQIYILIVSIEYMINVYVCLSNIQCVSICVIPSYPLWIRDSDFVIGIASTTIETVGVFEHGECTPPVIP